jgi:N-acetylmuramoyl-L-alanine amidase
MAKKLLVVLDPGHYPNYNKGAVYGYYEGDKMYDLSLYQKEYLNAYGIDVIITRLRDNDMGLYQRGQVAVKNGKGYKNVLFISNHSNACNGRACGVVVIRSAYLPESESLGKKLGDAITSVMKPVTGITYNRGVSTRKGNSGDYYGVIRGSVSGATSTASASKGVVKYSYIIEHGFHDNATECAFLVKNANLKKLAEAEARTIAEYFGIVKGSVKPTVSETEKTAVKTDKIESTVKGVQNWLNAEYGANLNADGIFGPITKEALIKAWQTEAGGLTVDGDFGTKSKAKAKTVVIKKGSTGNIVKIWQAYLVCIGADPKGIDGDFGNGCHTATVNYQTAHGLTADGIVGVNTWTKAFN